MNKEILRLEALIIEAQKMFDLSTRRDVCVDAQKSINLFLSMIEDIEMGR